MSTLPSLLGAHRPPLWIGWLVPALVLGAVIGWEIDWGRQVLFVPAAAPPINPKPVAPLLLPDYAIEGGLAANSETVSRTLFNATRRPAPPVAGEGGPRSIKAAGQFQLVGTTMSGENNIAFLRELPGGKSHTVRQGDTINGILVAQVSAERVKLTLNGEAEELVLKVAPGPKTTIGAAPPPPGAAPAAARGTQVFPPQQERSAVHTPAPAELPLQQVENARAARRAARANAAQVQGGAGLVSPTGGGFSQAGPPPATDK